MVALIALGFVSTAAASPTSTYTGAGSGALKDKVTIRVSSNKVVSYKLSIETLCGQVNAQGEGDARQTVVWPVTPNAGEAPLRIQDDGSFSGKQHEATMIPPIDNLTPAPAPGTYSFSISGKFNRSKSKVEGRLSLKLETDTRYFCAVSASPFLAKRT